MEKQSDRQTDTKHAARSFAHSRTPARSVEIRVFCLQHTRPAILTHRARIHYKMATDRLNKRQALMPLTSSVLFSYKSMHMPLHLLFSSSTQRQSYGRAEISQKKEKEQCTNPSHFFRGCIAFTTDVCARARLF